MANRAGNFPLESLPENVPTESYYLITHYSHLNGYTCICANLTSCYLS